MTEDEARKRLQQYGPNLLKPKKRTDTLALLLAQFKSPLTLTLTFATLLSLFLGDSVDSTIIFVIILASSLLGFWQERSATNAL